ncbi:MAG: hypothetical protein NDI94_01965 [Candidatus Woesearchaeota archaeon]|nr:hypothetical protein [Candidatus Woesearchaeota archaeon]
MTQLLEKILRMTGKAPDVEYNVERQDLNNFLIQENDQMIRDDGNYRSPIFLKIKEHNDDTIPRFNIAGFFPNYPNEIRLSSQAYSELVEYVMEPKNDSLIGKIGSRKAISMVDMDALQIISYMVERGSKADYGSMIACNAYSSEHNRIIWNLENTLTASLLRLYQAGMIDYSAEKGITIKEEWQVVGFRTKKEVRKSEMDEIEGLNFYIEISEPKYGNGPVEISSVIDMSKLTVTDFKTAFGCTFELEKAQARFIDNYRFPQESTEFKCAGYDMRTKELGTLAWCKEKSDDSKVGINLTHNVMTINEAKRAQEVLDELRPYFP